MPDYTLTQGTTIDATLTQGTTIDATIAGTIDAVSPYAPVLATSPTLFVPLKHASTDVDGQILYQDAACTVPVTSAGDPVGGVKWDGTIVATQSTDANRPVWLGDTIGVHFDGSTWLVVPNKSQTNFLHQAAASAAWRVTWDGYDGGGVNGSLFASNSYTRGETGVSTLYDDRDSRSQQNAVTLIVGEGSGDPGSLYNGEFGDFDIPSGDHTGIVTYDMTNPAHLYIDGVQDADTVSKGSYTPASGDSTDLMHIGGDPAVLSGSLLFFGEMQALVFYSADLSASGASDVHDALEAM